MADVEKKDLNTSIERLYKFKEETKRQFERMDAESNALKNSVNSKVSIKDFN
jgi:hypothetical protein